MLTCRNGFAGLAGTLLLATAMSTSAQAQAVKHVPETSATASEAAMSQIIRQAKRMERRLPALPREATGLAPKIPQSAGPAPSTTPGDPGPVTRQQHTYKDPQGPTGPGVGSIDGSIGPQNGGIGVQNYGTGNLGTIYHYTDMQVDTELMDDYPFRPTGLFLFQQANLSWASCTASLISRSIIVTAGHCVHDGGNRDAGWIKQGFFYPGYTNGAANPAYGRASARTFVTTSGWFNSGQLDKGYDVAVVALNKREGTNTEIGTATGWYGFCNSNCLQQYFYLTQLGYPGNYYSGNFMTEGQHLESSDSRDFLLGSGMQGGSSGGPHIANLGVISDSSTSPGLWATRNVVFAVTSWGYNDQSRKIQGASPLTGPGAGDPNNFRSMFNTACLSARAAHGTATCTTY